MVRNETQPTRLNAIPTEVKIYHGRSIIYRLYFVDSNLYANFTSIERGASPLHGRFRRKPDSSKKSHGLDTGLRRYDGSRLSKRNRSTWVKIKR